MKSAFYDHSNYPRDGFFHLLFLLQGIVLDSCSESLETEIVVTDITTGKPKKILVLRNIPLQIFFGSLGFLFFVTYITAGKTRQIQISNTRN